MSAWKAWPLQTWNQRLLEHYFRGRGETTSTIASLLVTADEFAYATGDPSADADEVRDAFVSAVRTWLRRSRKSLLEDACFYPDWPGSPTPASPPPFVGHLLFTCIAASESSEELADEASFVARLRELTGDQLPDHTLQWLPRLWEFLTEWLQANAGSYHRLILPEPGAFTRIGYTIKLAFPDRRDQRQVSDLLDRAGLSGQEPPVGRVLALMAAERSRFRHSFIREFDEFRRLFETSDARLARRLAGHRFWAAIREASFRGRGQSGSFDVAARLSLLAQEEEERLALFAVAEDQIDSEVATSVALPVRYGLWRFALVPKTAEALDEQQLDRVLHALLSRLLRLPRLSGYVDQGVLPFFAAPHGLLELAGPEQLAEASLALVRTEMVGDLLRIMDNGAAFTRPSAYEGWVQVHNLRLAVLPSERVEGTSLARTWIVQESLTPVTSRLVGGIRADGGWLGVHEILPRVVARGAAVAVLEGAESNTPLISLGDDTWELPAQDLAGEYTIVISGEGIDDRRTIRFHAAPTSESFKPATDPAAWIVEQVGGTGTLSDSLPFANEIGDGDCAPLSERVALLGPEVGAFVASVDAAAWKVVHFAGKLLGARGVVRGEQAVPTKQVASPAARRRWRKLLFESVPDWSDPEFAEARRIVKADAAAHGQLPRLELTPIVADLAPLRLTSPSNATGRLVRVVAGRATARAGIDWKEWSELIKRILNVDETVLQQVTRAWMEAGLIDVASSARWWHRRIFARAPRLVAFRSGECFGAALSGLTLATTIDQLRRLARGNGLLVEDRYSVSPLVPQTLSFRAPDRRALEDLAAASQLRLVWLDMAHLRIETLSRHGGMSAPPQHYGHSTRWSRWSLTQGDHADVTFEHFMRRDRPDYWIASHADRRVWFYDLNLTRAWAASLLGEPIVSAVGDAYLEAVHAYLPLPIARVISVIGAGLSGPTGATYRYAVGNPRLREFALDVISRTFNPSRLAVPATEQTSE